MPEILNTVDFQGMSDDEIFGDVNAIESAAQQIAQQQQIQSVNTTKAPVQQINNPIPGPPMQPVETQQEKELKEYSKDKEKLIANMEQLTKLAYTDKNGQIVRNFGMAQLVIGINNDYVRVNGLIILRALKVKCNSKQMEKNGDNKTKESASFTEEIAGYVYEVWGEMENSQLGLTSSYVPSSVVSILDLKGGYDDIPE